MVEYITIAEFAELAGVTAKAVYKRIRKPNNEIRAFVNSEGNQLTINKVALEVLYGIKVDNLPSPPSLQKGTIKQENEEQKQEGQRKEKKETPKETPSDKVIDILRAQLEAQRKDIEEKNIQIAELNERLAESQKMIDQQQKLSMADKQQILLLEEQARTSRELIQNKNKGFLKKVADLFKRKGELDNEQ